MDVAVGQLDIPAGRVALPPSGNHRIKLYGPGSVSGRCKGSRYDAAPGEFDIVPADCEGYWEQDAASRSTVVELSPRFLGRIARSLGLPSAATSLPERCGLRDARIEHLMHALAAHRDAGSPGGPLVLESLANALVHCLLEEFGALTPNGRMSRAEIARVREFIEANLDGELSLERLADVAAMSVSYLKVLFRRATGSSVHRYVVRRRVERARALILTSDLPLSEVALAVGFAHQSHMAKWMRREFDVTPARLHVDASEAIRTPSRGDAWTPPDGGHSNDRGA